VGTRKEVANVEKESVQESVYQAISNEEITHVASDGIFMSAQAARESNQWEKGISWKCSCRSTALMIFVSPFVLLGVGFLGFDLNSGL